MTSRNVVTSYEQRNAEKLIWEYKLSLPKKSLFMSEQRYEGIYNQFIKDASKAFIALCSIAEYKGMLPKNVVRYHKLCKIAEENPAYTLKDIPDLQRLTGKEKDFFAKILQQHKELETFYSDIYSAIQEMENQARKKIFDKAVSAARPGQVVILRTDSTIAYEENRRKFEESIQNMSLGTAAFSGIVISGLYYDQIVFMPERVKDLKKLFSLWCPDPLRVKVCYRY